MPAKKTAAVKSSNVTEPKRRGRKRAPENETKEAKFIRLAQYRMTKTLANLGQVKRLARYPHTPEQGEKICDALRDALNQIEVSFSEPAARAEKATFTL